MASPSSRDIYNIFFFPLAEIVSVVGAVDSVVLKHVLCGKAVRIGGGGGGFYSRQFDCR
jgi:hypothetical protein